MDRTFARRLVVSSLVVAGAAGAVSACSSSPPDLPPDSNPIHVAARRTPPISGGTLTIAGDRAIAADSDRDVVWLVDLPSHEVRKVALQEGDEPGRVVADDAGRAHVALRGAGAIATIDLASGKVVRRTNVCAAPRGLAYDAPTQQLHVACAGGELVSLTPSGDVARALHLDRDLRDAVVEGDRLLVSRFRSAQVLVVDADGNVLNRQTPPQLGANGGFGTTFTATVGWRMVPLAGGGVLMSHQRSADGTVVISEPDGYGNGGDPCGDGTIVNSTVTVVDDDGNVHGDQPAPSITGATLPVDVAVNGSEIALVSAGTDSIFLTSTIALAAGGFDCGGGVATQETSPGGQPVAVAAWQGQWIAQTREPAGLALIDNGQVTRIELPGESVADSGHDLFHHAASPTTHLACASCHPEGSDDSHVWFFDTLGARRTQTVAGGVLDTAPLHWDGDMEDLGMIMHEVFVNRMGGSSQQTGPRRVDAFADWIQSIPAPHASPRGTQAQIDHGKAIFDREDVGCAKCHSGAHFTNNQNFDVGTGHAVQVPTLVGIAARAPYMHDGCAATLRDRFDPAQSACNGGDLHGKTSQLAPSEVDDLVAYLESL